MAPLWGVRTVILEHSASATSDAACAEHARFEEAFAGLQWLLARNPDIGQVADVDGENWWVYVQASDEIALTPEIWVLYQVTAQNVTIEQINVKPYEPESD